MYAIICDSVRLSIQLRNHGLTTANKSTRLALVQVGYPQHEMQNSAQAEFLRIVCERRELGEGRGTGVPCGGRIGKTVGFPDILAPATKMNVF